MRKITKLLTYFTVIVLVSSCGATAAEKKAEKKAAEALYAQKIDEAIKSMDFTIEITQIIPRSFPSKITQDGYTIEIKGNTVTTYLPYFGVSRSSIAPSDEQSINVKKQEVIYGRDFSKPGQYKLSFTAMSGKDKWEFVLQIFDNGSVNIGCRCTDRDSMSYLGEIVFED